MLHGLPNHNTQIYVNISKQIQFDCFINVRVMNGSYIYLFIAIAKMKRVLGEEHKDKGSQLILCQKLYSGSSDVGLNHHWIQQIITFNFTSSIFGHYLSGPMYFAPRFPSSIPHQTEGSRPVGGGSSHTQLSASRQPPPTHHLDER